MRLTIVILALLLALPGAFAQVQPIAPVYNVTSGLEYEDIGAAMQDISAGDHLQLAAARFIEHVSISVPMTLSGDPNGTTIIDVSTMDGWGVTLSSDNITLKDLTIVGAGANNAYAVHSEPGITGLTLQDIVVTESTKTCIDLNGLIGPSVNTLNNITVSNSATGFGLALSTCSNVLIENITSSGNGFGDIAIMESNYYDQEVNAISFAGNLDLEGPQNLGGGGVIIQIDPEEIPVGMGSGFPISMTAEGFEYLLEASGDDLTGCILVHNDNVRSIAASLGAEIQSLVSYSMISQDMAVFPGMSVQSAVDVAEDNTTIKLEPGAYDEGPITVGNSVHLVGANVGLTGTDAAMRDVESVLDGIVVTGGHPTIDGIRVNSESGSAIEVLSNAEGLTVKNSVISGNGSLETAGIIARHSTDLEDVRVTGFDQGVLQHSGNLSVSNSWFKENQTGLKVSNDMSSADVTTVESCLFENAGGEAVNLHAGEPADAFTMTDCTLQLHGVAYTKTADMASSLLNNTFSNSELQIAGVDREGQIDLCSTNNFTPALRITGCTDEAADNYEACANINQACMYEGCTSPKACNYDPSANSDDGSCDFVTCAACPLGFACNYDPDADLYKVGACDFASCEGEGMSGVGEDRSGLTLIDGCTIPQACNYNANADADDGSCEFDCFGCMNSEACNFEEAFTQASNETCLFIQDLHPSPFVDCEGTCYNDVNDNGVCDEEEVSGCMDPVSCNFLGEATIDDGSCDYTSCAGCINPAACNHDADAWVSDGSCDYSSCSGCVAQNACNYDPSAMIDDGTCLFPVDLYNKGYVDCDDLCLNDTDGDGICDEEEQMGCTDSGACNFDAEATDDDSSCEFSSCAGCTNENYCNYNPMATLDNGSCANPEDLYPDAMVDGVSTVDCLGRCLNDANENGICDEEEPVCPGDFNGDGLRGAADILVMLGAFGCQAECGEPDLNGDGMVAASDILMALATFGMACSN